MPFTTEYIPFAVGFGANTLAPATYAGRSEIGPGCAPGEADATLCNTIWRQTSVGIAGLAKLAIDYGTMNLPDDGNPATFEAAFLSALQALIGAAVPAGAVMDFAMQAAPVGWVEAMGQVVNRAGTYAALFAAIGTTYNVGGETGSQFRLPDFRGKFRRGWDHGRGVDPARAFASNQQDALQNITGDFGCRHGGVFSGETAGAFAQDGVAEGHINAGISGTDPSWTFDASRVARTAAETRPTNIAVLTCIKI